MRILATGSRNWTDIDSIRKVLESLKADDLSVIQGGNGYLKSGKTCRDEAELLRAVRGADALVYQVCKELRIDVQTKFADWAQYSSVAGPKRNAAMLSWLLEDRTRQAVAFHDNIDASKGTKGMLLMLRRAKVPVTLFGH